MNDGGVGDGGLRVSEVLVEGGLSAGNWSWRNDVHRYVYLGYGW